MQAAETKRLGEPENEEGRLKKLPVEAHLEDFRAKPVKIQKTAGNAGPFSFRCWHGINCR